MDRERIVELLRMVLTAFVIALIVILAVEPLRSMFYFNTYLGRYSNYAIMPETYSSYDNSRNTPEINIYPAYRREVDIPMTPERALSGMTKEEILNIRYKEMRTSPVFSRMRYTPDSYVFQIDDGLPWISKYGQMHWSEATEKEKTEGITRDSTGIMNPELLYYVSVIDFYKKDEDEGKYLYNTFNFLPYRVTYTPNNKTITAYIRNERNENGDYLPINLCDSNAHDLGYHYAYMDSYSNLGFYKKDQYKNNYLKSGIKDITGYFMHGTACGIPGGCNNYAPYWQYYNKFYLKDLPASFNIKLWRNRPLSTEDDADINFRMVFE